MRMKDNRLDPIEKEELKKKAEFGMMGAKEEEAKSKAEAILKKLKNQVLRRGYHENLGQKELRNFEDWLLENDVDYQVKIKLTEWLRDEIDNQGDWPQKKASQKKANPDDDYYEGYEPDDLEEFNQAEGDDYADDWFDDEDTLFGTIKDIQPEGGSLVMFLIEDENGATMMVPAEARMAINAIEDAFGSVQDAIGETIYFRLTDYGTMAGFDTGKNLSDYYPAGEERSEGQEKLFSRDNMTKEANSLLMVIQNLRNMPTSKLLENLDQIKAQLERKITKTAQNLRFEPGEIDEMGQGGMWRIYVWNVIWNAVQQAERELIGKLSLTHDEENRSIVIQVFNDLVENLKSAVEAKEIESSDDSMNKEAQEFPQRSRGTSDEYFTLSITLNYDGSIQAENNANMKHREWADEELGDDFHNLVAWIKNELTEGRYQLVASAEGMTKEAQDKELMDFVFSAEDISKTAQTKKQAQTRIPISSLQIPHTVVKALHRKGITFTDQIDANLEVIRETLTEAQMAQLSRGLEGAVSPGREVSLDEDVSADAETNKINETELENEGESIPDGDLGEESLEEDLLEVAASTKKVATQGAYIGSRRPKTKKELKEAIQTNPDDVSLEATSMFGNEYSGSISNAPDGKYYVVGPDPQVSRKWYAQIVISGGSITVK